MGTSLTVTPFANIIRSVGKDVPRLLINNNVVAIGEELLNVIKEKLIDEKEGSGLFKFEHVRNRRDVFAGGDCQEAVVKLIRALGWEQEFLEILRQGLR
jgi:hypothetical protein